MKKISIYSLTGVLIAASVAIHADQPTRSVKIGTKILGLVDGHMVNADVVELIRKYRRQILSILLGDPISEGKRKGKYVFQDKFCGVRDLAEIEQEMMRQATHDSKISKALNLPLIASKNDFIAISEEFRSVAHSSKSMMAILIQESCEKRNRLESLLIMWSKTTEAKEDEIFEQHVKTFKDFEEFLIDLYNFLGDMIYSCPKAQSQFELRLDKFKKIQDIFCQVAPTINNQNLENKKQGFLRYIKEKHLDKLSLEAITKDNIRDLITEFIKKST